MRRIPEEEGKRWLRQAERDLDDARYAFKGKRYNLTCFLAQQAAEKALKGYLYAQGAELVMGHSVRELVSMRLTLTKISFSWGLKSLPSTNIISPLATPTLCRGAFPSRPTMLPTANERSPWPRKRWGLYGPNWE